MGKADAIKEEVTPEERESMELEERSRDILSCYYRDTLDADGLWQELKKENSPLLIKMVQTAFLDTLSLTSSSFDVTKRQKGILATESLKEGQMNFLVDRVLNQLISLKEEYQKTLDSLKERMQEEFKKNSRMQMRPVKTRDGRTVLQASPHIDEEKRRQFSLTYQEVEKSYQEKFLELKKRLQEELAS